MKISKLYDNIKANSGGVIYYYIVPTGFIYGH